MLPATLVKLSTISPIVVWNKRHKIENFKIFTESEKKSGCIPPVHSDGFAPKKEFCEFYASKNNHYRLFCMLKSLIISIFALSRANRGARRFWGRPQTKNENRQKKVFRAKQYLGVTE